jgi:hypothetical protein
MKKRFTPEMFRKLIEEDFYTFTAAEIANSVLEKWIAEAPKVYCYKKVIEEGWMCTEQKTGVDTHQAVLFDIEKILKKKCEHINLAFYLLNGGLCSVCIDCNAKFKQSPNGWTEVD